MADVSWCAPPLQQLSDCYHWIFASIWPAMQFINKPCNPAKAPNNMAGRRPLFQCQSAKRLICMGIFPFCEDGSQITILQTTQTRSPEDTLASRRKRTLPLQSSRLPRLPPHHSTRVIRFGLKPKSAALPLRPRAARALLRLRISRVSSRSLPPRPIPSMRMLRV